MKLTLRWKYFFILLAFSLVPLLFLREVIGVAGERMLSDVAERTRTDIGDLMQQGLRSSVAGATEVLESKATAFKLATSMLSSVAADRFRRDITDPTQPFTVVSRMRGPQPPFSDTTIRGYYHSSHGGGLRSLAVDPGKLSILLPPTKTKEEERHDIDILAGLYPTMREIYESLDGTPLWVHVDLASGLHASYPGHGDYPMMYDARLTSWYRKAVSGTDPSWMSPVVDPVTRQVLGVISAPIHDADGTLIGTATLDIPLRFLLQESRLSEEWGGDQLSFLTTWREKEDHSATDLLVLAKRDYNAGRANWHTGIERDLLQSDDTDAFTHFVRRTQAEPSGVATMPYKGEPCLWAFASRKDFSFIIILPQRAVEGYPTRVSRAINGMFLTLRQYSLFGIICVIFGVAFFALYWSNKTTSPLVSMARTARRISEGNFSARLDVSFGDERDIVIRTLNQMGPRLQEYMSLRRDLELASTIQELLLPQDSPSLRGFEIAGSLAYSEQTGGDYFDFLPVMGKQGPAFAIVVGDVSGHGMQAALLMATARALLHGLSGAQFRLEKRIRLVNRNLSTDLEGTGRFMTMFYLQLAENNSEISWVRAGHEPAYTLRPGNEEFQTLMGEGLPLGVDADLHYTPGRAELVSGELVVLATDGVWEARSPEGRMFGKKRMLAIIRQNRDKRVKEIVQAVFEEVSRFTARHRLEDDMTLVIIRRDEEYGDDPE